MDTNIMKTGNIYDDNINEITRKLKQCLAGNCHK